MCLKSGQNSHLVLKGFLPFLSTHKVFYPSSTFAIAKIDEFLHLGFIFRSEDPSLLHQDLAIISVGISPLQILVWSFLHMHLHVLQSVLFDIANTKVGVLFDSAQLRDGFTSEKLDQG